MTMARWNGVQVKEIRLRRRRASVCGRAMAQSSQRTDPDSSRLGPSVLITDKYLRIHILTAALFWSVFTSHTVCFVTLAHVYYPAEFLQWILVTSDLLILHNLYNN